MKDLNVKEGVDSASLTKRLFAFLIDELFTAIIALPMLLFALPFVLNGFIGGNYSVNIGWESAIVCIIFALLPLAFIYVPKVFEIYKGIMNNIKGKRFYQKIIVLIALLWMTIFVAVMVIILVGLSSFLSLSRLIYYPAYESSKYKATIGKLLMGIKVENKDGTTVSFSKSLGRYLLLLGIVTVVISVCVLVFNFAFATVENNIISLGYSSNFIALGLMAFVFVLLIYKVLNKTLHDAATGTLVVNKK